MTLPSYDNDNLVNEYGTFIRQEFEANSEFYLDLFVEAFQKALANADGITKTSLTAIQFDQEELFKFFSGMELMEIEVTLKFNNNIFRSFTAPLHKEDRQYLEQTLRSNLYSDVWSTGDPDCIKSHPTPEEIPSLTDKELFEELSAWDEEFQIYENTLLERI